jgi:hypothetical protein
MGYLIGLIQLPAAVQLKWRKKCQRLSQNLAIAFHRLALRAVTLWESLLPVQEDYRLSQFHRLCLQVKALMQWVYSPETIGITTTIIATTIIAATITIVSDGERLF